MQLWQAPPRWSEGSTQEASMEQSHMPSTSMQRLRAAHHLWTGGATWSCHTMIWRCSTCTVCHTCLKQQSCYPCCSLAHMQQSRYSKHGHTQHKRQPLQQRKDTLTQPTNLEQHLHVHTQLTKSTTSVRPWPATSPTTITITTKLPQHNRINSTAVCTA